MDVHLRNKFTFIGWDKENEISEESITVNSTNVNDLVQVVEEFERFLKGCGYEFDKLVPVISDYPEFDDDEEPFIDQYEDVDEYNEDKVENYMDDVVEERHDTFEEHTVVNDNVNEDNCEDERDDVVVNDNVNEDLSESDDAVVKVLSSFHTLSLLDFAKSDVRSCNSLA